MTEPAGTTKTLIMSDLHLSSKRACDKGWAFYDTDAHRRRLVAFLTNHVAPRAGEFARLVLLGDIFDNWTFPPNEAPDSYETIVSDNADEMSALRDVQQRGVRVSFLPGNHDYDITPEQLAAALPGADYEADGLHDPIRAHHGHEFTRVNVVLATDCASHEAPPPAGYFSTRGAIGAGMSRNDYRAFLSSIDDLTESLVGGQRLTVSAIESGAEMAGMAPTDSFRMSDGSQISVLDLKQQYDRLDRDFNASNQNPRVILDAMLGRIANKLHRNQGSRVVVFGHTHGAVLDLDWLPVRAIYANTGGWIDEEAHCVEIDTAAAQGGSSLKVNLHTVAPDGSISGTMIRAI